MLKPDCVCVYEPVYLHPISACEFQKQACPSALAFHDATATFRIISGNAVMFSRKLRKRSERGIYMRRLDDTPFVECVSGMFFSSAIHFLIFIGAIMGIFLLNQRLYPRPIDIFRRRVVLFILMKDNSPM